MKFKKVYSLTSVLPKEVFVKFKSSEWSPYKECRPQVKKLHKILCRYYDKQLPPEKLAKLLSVSIDRVDDLVNKLVKALEVYFINLTAKDFVTAALSKDLYLLEFYIEYQLWDNLSLVKKRLDKQLGPKNAIYPNDFIQLSMYYKHLAVISKFKNNQHTNTDVERMVWAIDASYAYEKLKYLAEAVKRTEMGIPPCDFFNKEELDYAYYLGEKYREIPSIALLKEVLVLMVEKYSDFDSKYQKIKKHLNTVVELTDNNDELGGLVYFVMNICVKGVNSGNLIYCKEYISYIELLEKNDLILEQGKLTLRKLNNSLNCAVKLGEYKWGNDFLDRYEDKLSQGSPIYLGKYFRALIAFHQGQYSKAYNMLPPIGIDDVLDKHLELKIEKLYLQLCLEIPDLEHDNFDSLLKNFERKLSKYKLSPVFKDKCTIFVKYAEYIVGLTSKQDLIQDADAHDNEWFSRWLERKG